MPQSMRAGTCSKPPQEQGIWFRARTANEVGTTQLTVSGNHGQPYLSGSKRTCRSDRTGGRVEGFWPADAGESFGLCGHSIQPGTWYVVDFEDEQFGGYSVSQLEMLLRDCNFLDLIERPGLWRSGLRWVVLPGMRPETAV